MTQDSRSTQIGREAAVAFAALSRAFVQELPAPPVELALKSQETQDQLTNYSRLPWSRFRRCVDLLDAAGIISFRSGGGRGRRSELEFISDPVQILRDALRGPDLVDAPEATRIRQEVERLEGVAQASLERTPIQTWWRENPDGVVGSALSTPGSDAAFADDPMYGRESEIANLADHAYRNSCTVLAGQPGVGKTHLIAKYQSAVLNAARGSVGLVWLKLNEESVLDELASALSLVSSGASDSTPQRAPTGVAAIVAYWILQELKSSSYLVILDNFEMIMNADLGTVTEDGYRELLDLITHHGTGPSRVILGSWWVPRDRQGRRPPSIELEGLSALAVHELLRGRGVDLTESEIFALLAKTDGNPLAIETMLYMLRGAPVMADRVVAPEAIKAAFARLSRNDVLIMGTVAISEDESPEPLIRYVVSEEAHLSEHDLSQRLDDLTITKLLLKYRWDARTAERKYSMHTLSRNYAVSGALDPEEVKGLHQKAMDYWWDLGQPSNPLDTAWLSALRHALGGQQYGSARKLVLDTGVGDALFSAGRFSELRQVLERLLDLRAPFASIGSARLRRRARDCSFEEHLESLVRMASETYWRLGSLREAKACLNLLNDEFDVTSRSMVGLAGVMLETGEHATGLALARQALDLARETDDRRAEMEAWGWIGYALDDAGPVEECLKAYGNAMALSDRLSDRHTECLCQARIGMTLWKVGRIEESRTFFVSALELAETLDDPYLLGLAQGDMGHYYLDKPASNSADVQEAEGWYLRALETHRRAGVRRGEGFWLGQLGRVDARRGQFAAARQRLVAAIDIHLEVGDMNAIPRHLWYLAQLIRADQSSGQPLTVADAYYNAAASRFEAVNGLLEAARVRIEHAEFRSGIDASMFSVRAGVEAGRLIDDYITGTGTSLP